MIYLDLEDLLHVADRTLGGVQVRDLGLLQAAVVRPRTSAFGQDAYGSLHHKVAALMHSVARNHALVEGNKRLALASTIAFYGMNGYRPILTTDGAYDLIIAVSTGKLDEVDAIAQVLEVSVEETRK